MKHHARSSRHGQKGATLTEVAIVMLVITIVTSGIWVAWANVSRQQNLARVSDQLQITATNMRALYASRNTVALTPTTDLSAFTNTITAVSNGIATQNVFPPDMLNTTAGTGASSSWKKPVYVGIVNTGTANKFVIEYDMVPDTATCMGMVTGNSVPGKETGLAQIDVIGGNNSSFKSSDTPPTLPVLNSSTQLRNACTPGVGGGTLTVKWYYTFGPGCDPGAPC